MSQKFSPDSAAEIKELGDLPQWRLEDLYPDQDSQELHGDLKKVEQDAAAFRADYDGKLAGLTGAGLAEAINRFEAVELLAVALQHRSIQCRDAPFLSVHAGEGDSGIEPASVLHA